MPHAPADLAHGVFSDTAPWTVDPRAMAWRSPVPALRAQAHRRLPSLLHPPRVPPLKRALVVAAHLGVAVVGWTLAERRRGGTVSRAGISRRLRVAAERLGPTFIKLGQIISSGEGIFPAELVAEFVRCRDQVPPEDFATVRRIVEEDLGWPLAAVFAEFEEIPVAAASIAQVHRARIRHDRTDLAGAGSEVVVKVQRPTVAARVLDDLAVMAWLAPRLVGRIPVTSLANPPALVEVFAHTISEELDFRIEADNMLDVARVLAELDQRRFVIPRPHPMLVTRRVLVMERLDGFRFDDLASYDRHAIDTHSVVRAGMIAFMEGALIHGVFHGDLHGGNLFVRPDGRTALLDFGITGRLSPPRRRAFLRLLVAGTMNDVTGQLAALRDLGALPPDTDLDAVARDLGLFDQVVDPTTLTPDELVAELQRVLKSLLGYGARLPRELMLFVKNMVFLDGAIARLAPDLDLFAEIAHVATHFATTHGERLAAEIGMDPTAWRFEPDAVRAAFGVDETVESMTYGELRERREIIRRRLRAARR